LLILYELSFIVFVLKGNYRSHKTITYELVKGINSRSSSLEMGRRLLWYNIGICNSILAIGSGRMLAVQLSKSSKLLESFYKQQSGHITRFVHHLNFLNAS
jgi:hypothetical protein